MMVSMTTGILASAGSALSVRSTFHPSLPGIITSSVMTAWLELAGQFDPFLAAQRRHDRDPFLFQGAPDQVVHGGIVVDDEDHPLRARP